MEIFLPSIRNQLESIFTICTKHFSDFPSFHTITKRTITNQMAKIQKEIKF